MAGGGTLSTRDVMSRFGPVILGLFCVQLDFFSLGLALPTIAKDLGTTTTALQWVVSGYMLAIGALMIPMSRLADTLGRKRVLMTGIGIFGLSSLICGLVDEPGPLIAARVLQGVGGAIILPVSFALVSNRTTDEERPKALGAMLGFANVGTALGPIMGGGFAASIGWRWIFWVNVPFAVVAVIWGSLTLAESKDRGSRPVRDIDWIGVALVSVGIAAVSFGLDEISSAGLLAVTTLGSLALGVALLVALARQERRHPWPLISPSLLRIREFVVLTSAGALANAAYCLMIIIVTIQLQQVRDLGPAEAGLIFAVPATATAVCGPISGWLAPRFDGGIVMAACIVLGALSLILQAVSGPLWLDVIGLATGGFALGMGWTFTAVATQSVLPAERASEASGFVLTALITIGAFGVVLAATGLELFGAEDDLATACRDMLLWSGIVCLVLGMIFGISQLRRTASAGVSPGATPAPS